MKQVLTAVVLMMALGCGDAPVHPASIADAKPLKKQLGKVLLVYSDQLFPTETPLEIRLEAVPIGATVQGKIVGTNMAMGTIPLFFTPTADGQWSGQFMLGACTEPVMHWQLQLQLTLADGTTSLLSDTFEVARR